MASVTLFSDFICPYCYVGEHAARGALEALGLDLEWRGFEIHPEIPPGGIPAESLARMGFGGQWRRVEEFAAAARVPIARPPLLSSSRLALEGAELARREGRLAEYRDRVFRAYFTEGADIGEPEVLSSLASEAGLDRTRFETEVLARRFGGEVDRNRDEAEDLLVTAVPAFFLHGVAVVGAQSTEAYREAFSRILSHRARRAGG
jgi:predicted DsbA family dithiol-disulfide isomerase